MFQPKFPLKLSDTDGAYSSIRELKETIKQNVVILLSVSPGEWPGNPQLGVGVRRFLFANYPSQEVMQVHKSIKDQFAKFLPFLEVSSEIIEKDSQGRSLADQNQLKLVVRYNIPPLNESD